MKYKCLYEITRRIEDVATFLVPIADLPKETEQEPTYTSTQATNCAGCGEHKHTPLRIDAMGGYVCLTCIDKKLGSLLGEFGYAQPEQRSVSEHLEPVAWRGYNWGHSPDDWVYRDFDDPILDGNGNNVGQPLYTTPPQRKETEQEPVPDMYVKDINGNFHSYKEKGHTVSSQCVPPSHVGVGEDDFTPQRKPLTDEQILHFVDTHVGVPSMAYPLDNSDWMNFARAIEAAHNIKD